MTPFEHLPPGQPRVGEYLLIEGKTYVVVRSLTYVMGGAPGSGWGVLRRVTKAGAPTGKDVEVKFGPDRYVGMPLPRRRILSTTWAPVSFPVPARSNPRKPYTHATEVQSLLFDADLFTAKSAKAWARSHGFRYGKVDEGGPSARYIRLRQHEPSEYRPSTFRTISLDADETVKAVVGVPLRAVAATRPASYDSRGPRSNPFGKYRGVSYYHTAGVYRAHLPDGTTRVFGAKDGGKRGMQEFIDGYLWAPGEVNAAKNPRRNGRKPAAILAAGKDPSDALEGIIAGSTVEFRSPGDFRGWIAGRVTGFENDEHGLWLNVAGGGSSFTVPHAWVRLPSYGRVLRNNPSSRERVVVPGLGTGTVVARRPGGMVDVRLSSGMIVRKPSSSLRPA